MDRDELPLSTRLGDELEAEREDGSVVFMRVIGLSEEIAELDLNHPLAGKTLTFDVNILKVEKGDAPDVPESKTP